MSTSVSVNTYTHTVTYVTGKMLGSLKDIIKWSGLNPDSLLAEWSLLESGIGAWLKSGHLKRVVLEVYNPKTNALVVRWDFNINYTYGSIDDGSMWADNDAIKHAIAKCGVPASTCNYSILVTTSPGKQDVAGWSSVSFRSTDGFREHSVGTTIGANSLGNQTSYWRKQ